MYPRFATALALLAEEAVPAFALGVTFGLTAEELLAFCLAVVAEGVVVVVAGRVLEVEGLLAVTGVVVRLEVVDVVEGLAVAFVAAGRVVVVVVEGLTVLAGLVFAGLVVGRPCVEGVRPMFCWAF